MTSSKKDTSIVPIQHIEHTIYMIRGRKVMLDRDLAELYGVETKALVQSVKRNLERFPEDFMFRLSVAERDSLRSQIVTLESDDMGGGKILRCQIGTLENSGRGKYSKYLPYAFTEQGVAMLSGLLRSPRAIAVNIEIMRAFVRFRHVLASQKEITKAMTELRTFVLKKSNKTEREIRKIWEAFEKFTTPPDNGRRIGFNLEPSTKKKK